MVICDFSTQRILFSFHSGGHVNESLLPPLPYSDTIRQLNHQKSGLLLRAQELQKNGEVAGEAILLFSKAADIEMQIAQLLQDAEHENAIIHWVSAASCYMQAKNYQSALEQLDRILTQPKLSDFGFCRRTSDSRCLRLVTDRLGKSHHHLSSHAPEMGG